MFTYEDHGERAHVLTDLRRVVVKVGTRLLTDVEGRSQAQRARELVAALAGLRERGLDVILVTSGAIGAGMSVLGSERRPTSLPQLQAHAAVGQCQLMYFYESACLEHGFHSAQLLLTAADVRHRERHLNVISCLDALLAQGVLPIINENDSVSVEEIKFGNNDVLAALTASMANADLTVLLTTVDGMLEPKPGGGWGRRLSVVQRVTPRVREMAGGTDGNRFSVGGMGAKLKAAEMVTRSGESLWIAGGWDFGVLSQIMAGRDVGTLFLSQTADRLTKHKRYLAFFSKPAGDIVVDAGAVRALCELGRSLLPSGILGVGGAFARGDTVRITDADGREVARGVTNYASDEVEKVRGRRTSELHDVLGYEAAAYDEVVHRNYLVLTPS